jgi:hypothetical protein
MPMLGTFQVAGLPLALVRVKEWQQQVGPARLPHLSFLAVQRLREQQRFPLLLGRQQVPAWVI